MASLIYLASPYTHPSEAVRYARYLVTRLFTIQKLSAGEAIFAPIVYGHDMETALGIVFEAWQPINDTMIEKCDAVWVLCLDGWRDSRGVRHELELAARLGKPVRYFDNKGTLLNVDP